MEMLDVLERFGLPVCMVLALGWYVKSQNAWIQNELQTELRESFERLEGIIIKLIDQSKLNQLEQAKIRSSISAVIEVMAKLSGNGLAKKYLDNEKD
jgi:hypothetical protein